MPGLGIFWLEVENDIALAPSDLSDWKIFAKNKNA